MEVGNSTNAPSTAAQTQRQTPGQAAPGTSTTSQINHHGSPEGLASISATALPLLELPVELVVRIGTLLEPPDDKAFADICRMTKELYQLHILKQKSSRLLRQNFLEAKEMETIQRYYYFILQNLFQSEIIDEEFEKTVLLAQQFLKHIPRSFIRRALLQVLSENPGRLPQVFERLANVDLPLAISLISTLSNDELKAQLS